MRQRITRLRDTIEKKFLEALDVQLADDDVIQNDPRRGYRLNPYLLLVQPGQVRDNDQALAECHASLGRMSHLRPESDGFP